MHLRCPQCRLHLERQTGSFIGGIGLNTVVAFAALLTVIVGGFLRTGGEASIVGILIPALAVSTALPIVLYARSRLWWVAIELRWWPLELDEVLEVKL